MVFPVLLCFFSFYSHNSGCRINAAISVACQVSRQAAEYIIAFPGFEATCSGLISFSITNSLAYTGICKYSLYDTLVYDRHLNVFSGS